MHSKINLSGSELVQDRDGRTFYFPAWIKAGPFKCNTATGPFFTKPSNTFLKAMEKVLEGFVARNP